MLAIRLARVGKKKQPHYRVVVADSRRAVQAKFVDIVGWYNPRTKELKVQEENIKEWLSKGAQPSNVVAKLLKSQKFELPEWVKIVEKKKSPKKPAEEAAAPAIAVKEEPLPADEVEAAEAEEAQAKEEITEEETEKPVE